MWDDDYWFHDNKTNKMDSKNKHPFAITCRKCGSNSVAVIAYEYRDLGIRCKSCGFELSCGEYHTDENDYSQSH